MKEKHVMINYLLKPYLTIQNVQDFVPDVSHPYPFGFVDRGRGGMTFLNTGVPIHFMAVVEFDKIKGPRGRHKHLKRQEHFYVVSGQIQGTYWLEDEAEAQKILHPAGTLVILQPGLYHTYEAVQGCALALEFSPQDYDKDDYHYPPDNAA